jgi:predicted nicotinamide N-methyase
MVRPQEEMRMMTPVMCDCQRPNALGFRGLVHIRGPAGAGKSLLAVAIAAEVSTNSHVEWINTDGKSSFIPHLRRNIEARGGRMDSISITMAHNHNEALEAILNLVTLVEPDTALVVVDPVTRVVDMSNVDSTMWGEELIEKALPTLAALAANGVTVLATSENRSLLEGEDVPVHHQAIRRWADKEVAIQRERLGSYSTISDIDLKSGTQKPIGRLRLLNTGLIEVTPDQHESEARRNS